MFEFEDAKLGKVKVINITEARSSIAMIMNDGQYNYVITKNNRPIRVIINYDAYRESGLGVQDPSKPPKTESKPAPASSPLISSSISGLLSSREKDIKSQLAKKEEVVAEVQPLKKAVGMEEIYDFSSAPKQEPEDIDLAEEDTPLPAAVQEEPAAKEEELSEPEAEIDELVAQEIQGDDYFSRFKKLYEDKSVSREVPTPQAEKIVETIQLPQEDSLENYYEIPEDDYASLDFMPEPPSLSQPKAAAPAATPAPRENPPVESVPNETVRPPKRQPVKQETPSIHDLLKELESEKLSTEDDPALSQDEVQKLLNKISREG